MAHRTPASAEPFIKALRALIRSGLYAAQLEQSILIDLDVVVLRTDADATASVRARALIDIFEEIVERRLSRNDRAVAEILFGLGRWSGVGLQERHHAAAKLRNKHWTWENYRKEPLTRDLMHIFLALQREAENISGGPGDPTPPPPPDLAGASRGQIDRLGRRRTAYPLDMSLAELRNGQLLLDPLVARYHEPEARRPAYGSSAITNALAEGKSVLLLGEPGAGKSVAFYSIALACRDMGLIPLAVRATDFEELRAERVLAVLRRAPGTDGVVVLLDGLDELAATAQERFELPQGLVEVLSLQPHLVTSRLREYEDDISVGLEETHFDEVYVLEPWSVATQFRDYLSRLTRAGLIDGPALYETVVANERLTNLVSRPLYARMLTFVGERVAGSITEPVVLYGEYLTKLARVADAAWQGGPGVAGGALGLWQSVAWFAYVSGEVTGDAIAMAELAGVLDDFGPPAAVRRALDQIVDTRSILGREFGEFVHYSFYEYLVARHVADVILRDPTPSELAETLRHDLTREVRHYLTGQLMAIGRSRLRTLLTASYRSVRTMDHFNRTERLRVCNLLIYLLSRTVLDSAGFLTALLDEEQDSFLQSSILWALCHNGSTAGLHRFFDALEASEQWRAECRGYVLYYYGDMSRDDGPPYVDQPPYRPCGNSYRRVMAMFERPSFAAGVAPQRRYVDIYTFLDVLHVRSWAISEKDFTVIAKSVDTLRRDAVTVKLLARLTEMLSRVRPSA